MTNKKEIIKIDGNGYGSGYGSGDGNPSDSKKNKSICFYKVCY
jgi:hypothetical protein